MKKYFLIIFLALFIIACGSKKRQQEMEAEQDSMAVETEEASEGLIDDLESQFAEDTAATDTSSMKVE